MRPLRETDVGDDFGASESCGISFESVDGAAMDCFVGTFASGYDMIQGRDPEDRPENITVDVGRAILANRLSHFLNLK
ncbi:hypothetical protein S40293_10466 [Stachybotrys chartarum IBT 40293]|nr:hypothetical protein S40293_10466 [Stachybotrys chartarum IBT 40293]